MKLIFISNNWADAHQQTRLNSLLDYGISVECLAVYRHYYPVHSRICPIILGEIEHGFYKRRIKIYAQLFYNLRMRAKTLDKIYTYGFDLVLIVLLFKILSGRKVEIIYEIPDIRELFFSESFTGKLIRRIEKLVIPRLDLLIVTSPEFVSEYLIGLRKIRIRSYLVIENKVHASETPTAFELKEEKNDRIKIGYFGVLRCAASLHCLIKLAETNQFEIILRGIFMPATGHFETRIKHLANIKYLGPYRVPEDLAQIYHEADVIWAAYPFSDTKLGNHRWARTNRFYESLFFRRPMIVQKGSTDAGNAQIIGNFAIEIDLKNEFGVISHLCSMLNIEYLKSIKHAMHSIPESHYQITDEYQTLLKWLHQKNL